MFSMSVSMVTACSNKTDSCSYCMFCHTAMLRFKHNHVKFQDKLFKKARQFNKKLN